MQPSQLESILGWIDFYLIPRTNDKTVVCNIIHEVEEEKAGDGVEMEAMMSEEGDR